MRSIRRPSRFKTHFVSGLHYCGQRVGAMFFGKRHAVVPHDGNVPADAETELSAYLVHTARHAVVAAENRGRALAGRPIEKLPPVNFAGFVIEQFAADHFAGVRGNTGFTGRIAKTLASIQHAAA